MFGDIVNQLDWNTLKDSIYAKNKEDVLHALHKEHRDLEDFKALISPAATPFLEEMAVLSNQITQKRFGKTVQMYVPLYLSNICENHCVYCGFNRENRIKRTKLSHEEIMKEVEVLKSYGYEHVLLVAGEDKRNVGLEYYKEVIRLIKPHFALISMEVQPLEEHEYKELINEGLHSVYIYQETYHKENYNNYHLRGKKSDYSYRLHTPDRLGKAGAYKIGLGVLIGLEDWRTDSLFTALHTKYLEKHYWRTKYSVSLPRLRPHQGGFEPNFPMTDRELVQLICAYRIFNPDLEISISVRESETFRDNIIKLGITHISAGSKTDPGGYSGEKEELEQFEVHDDRSPQEIAAMIRRQGYEAVWKDWDCWFR